MTGKPFLGYHPEMAWLSEIQAAVRLRMSPRLLRWMSSYSPKCDGRKLGYRTAVDASREYEEAELVAFDKYLRAPWPTPPKGERPHRPEGILQEVKIEAGCGCALCEWMNNCEAAHIEAVAKSHSNHPHNLLWACPNHHTEYDKGHAIHGTVDSATVKAIKKDLLESRVRRWRAEARVESEFMLLAAEASACRERLKEAAGDQARYAIERQAVEVLESLRAAAAREPPVPPPAAEQRLRNRVVAGAKEAVAVALEQVSGSRDEYLDETNEVECPLCCGHGGTRDYDFCPVCRGGGSIDRERAAQVDLGPYEPVTCPLCAGRGETAYFDPCPVCDGDGDIAQAGADSVDLSAFALVACPLCKGTGMAAGYGECPVCEMEREIPSCAAELIDIRQFAIVHCPACYGRGKIPGYDECPACNGSGCLPVREAERVDVTIFQTVECPVCQGKGRFQGDNCPVCEGDKVLPRVEAERVDLSRFELVGCPLCKGKGRAPGYDECPPCGGHGQLTQGDYERIDMSLFELVDCPICVGRGRGRRRGADCPACDGRSRVERRFVDQILENF